MCVVYVTNSAYGYFGELGDPDVRGYKQRKGGAWTKQWLMRDHLNVALGVRAYRPPRIWE
ncbi:hypothetical protein [Saccharopolyspora gloriosae]|uniref:hypothetical protein n=1 Tax=Saccharopolyspora gloriosae TaxID=455344 RepID=UPI001FB6C30A|nr:hypothetical protein [Saccharopolyspora gloriosae]